jgi:hypothetical protein
MVLRMRQACFARTAFAVMALLALALRIAVPAGFMPAASAHGIVVAICSEHGGQVGVLPVKDRQSPVAPEAKPGSCTFAASSPGFTPPPAIAEAMPPGGLGASRLAAAVPHLTVHRLAAPPPPSHGPPAPA